MWQRIGLVVAVGLTELVLDYSEIGDDPLSFSPDSRHLVYKAIKNNKWCVVVEGQPGPPYDKLPLKPSVTNDAAEYTAERDGWLLRCRQPIPQAGAGHYIPNVE
jgi:hypothetical protein